MADPPLVQRIIDFIREEYLEEELPLSANTQLLSSGIIDSFSLASLVAWLETEFGVSLPEGELDASRFASPEKIAELVEHS